METNFRVKIDEENDYVEFVNWGDVVDYCRHNDGERVIEHRRLGWHSWRPLHNIMVRNDLIVIWDSKD